MTVVGGLRHVDVEVHEADRVDVERDRGVLTSNGLTTQHEVTAVDRATRLGHTAQVELGTSLTGSEVGRIGLQGEALVNLYVRTDEVSLAAFQIEHLILGCCAAFAIAVQKIIELAGLILRDVVDVPGSRIGTHGIVGPYFMLDENGRSRCTLGALHRGVEAGINGQRNLLVPYIDVVARVLRESFYDDLSDTRLVPCRLRNLVLHKLSRYDSIGCTGIGLESQIVDTEDILLCILEVPVLTELVLFSILIGSNVAVQRHLHRSLGDVGHLDDKRHPVAGSSLKLEVVSPLAEVTATVPRRVLRIVLPVGISRVQYVVDT